MTKWSQPSENDMLRLRKEGEFETLFPTERHHILAVYSYLEIDFTRCYICDSDRVQLCRNYRLLKCYNCRGSTWLTKGTFFEDMKHAKLALTALWFEDQGVALSASEASRFAGAARSSASALYKKLDVEKEELARSLGGDAVPSYVWIKSFRKRSRETPACKSPKDEEWEINRDASFTGIADLDSCDTGYFRNGDDQPTKMEGMLLLVVPWSTRAGRLVIVTRLMTSVSNVWATMKWQSII